MFRKALVLCSAALTIAVMFHTTIRGQEPEAENKDAPILFSKHYALLFCAIDPVWDDGEGNILYFAYDWEDTGPECVPGQPVYLWGFPFTKCPDLCSDGCSSNMHGIPVGFNIGAKTNGPRPRLINEPREGWDKWELHPHVEDPVDAKRLPVMLKADAGYQEKIVKPRAKTSDGKTKAHQVIDAHKVILKVKDGLEIPASLYNVVIDHKISGNPHRAPDGSTTFSQLYGVERLPDGGGTVIEPANITRLSDHSLLVRYQGLEYVVITKTETSKDSPRPTPSSPK